MAVSHVKSNAVADWTGTVTVFNSQASTLTTAATAMVRPVDWNSAHNLFYTLSGNTNNASTASGTNVVFQGLGNVTLVGSTATLGVSVAPGTATMWFPYNEAVNVNIVIDQGRMYVNPVPTPPTAAGGEIQIDRLVFPVHFTHTNASSGSFTLSLWFALYTKNNSTLSLAHSTSQTISWVWSSTVSTSVQRGIRLMTVPWTTSIPDGRYYVANIARSTTAGNSCTMQRVHVTGLNSTYSGLFNVASNASMQAVLGLGWYSTTTSALPASVAFSDLVGNSSNVSLPPSWFMISGTA